MSESVRIKICGVVTPEDAHLAASLGADWVGMILWEGSRRRVPDGMAKEIAVAARECGAEPVGVFVDGSAGEIADRAKGIGIETVQLHGDRARAAGSILPADLTKIWARDGEREDHMPEDNLLDSKRDWILLDSPGGGTGKAFPWERCRPPETVRWLLAGGLDPENVVEALRLLKPNGVDAATGVSDSGGIRKDPDRLKRFVDAVRGLEEMSNDI